MPSRRPSWGSYTSTFLFSALAPLLCLLLSSARPASAAIAVSAPAQPPSASSNVVYSNFFGLSVELSFANYYFGNTSAQTPAPVLAYLSALHARGSGRPVRVRIGGNSMDSSTYVPDQGDMIAFTDPDANLNDQPVTFGPQLFDVLKSTSDAVGGAQYLLGLSLRTPNSTNIPLVAGAAVSSLGDLVEAFLLGNEPDLYSAHGARPNQANYTVDNYVTDYSTVFNGLKQTPEGNVLQLDNIAGPTVCCFWDVSTVLPEWFGQFSEQIKYVTLQHYPQDSCSGKPNYGLGPYLVHSQTVSLTQWQSHGRQIAYEANKPVIMDEFNSLSCGGWDGISNTFGVGMWTSDYALQMAAQNYTAAYIHTREPGITYNPFDPPHTVAGGAGAWYTNTPFYAMLPVAEALSSADGSRVVDLNVENSMTDANATSAGYAVYNGTTDAVHSLVIFNYANASGTTSDYAIDGAFVPAYASDITVRYMAAPSVEEQVEIAWGGKTYAGVGDGVPVDATFSSALADKSMACAGGCTIQVPGPGVAVVFMGAAPNTTTTSTTSPSNNGSSSNGTSVTGTSSPASSGSSPSNGAGAGRTRSSVALGLVGALIWAASML